MKAPLFYSETISDIKKEADSIYDGNAKNHQFAILTIASKSRSVFCFLLIFIGGFSQAQVTIVLKSIPSNTPGSDTIFITGNFNDWAVNDPTYMLQRQLDGKLSYRFDAIDFPLEYKFTRGSWMKVETNDENEYLPNRELVATDSSELIVFARIENWQDLGGARPIGLIAFYYFAVAFLGLILIFIVQRTNKADPVKLWAFTSINAFLVLVLVASVIFHLVNIIWVAYIEMIFQILLFAWGAVLHVFLLSFQKNPFQLRNLWLLSPALIMCCIALLEVSNSSLIAFMNTKWNGLPVGNIGTVTAALLSCALFFFFSRNIIRKGAGQYRPITHLFIKWFFRINLSIWFILIAYMTSFLIRWSSTSMTYDVILIPFSTIIIFEMYYLWKFPEILYERPLPATPIAQSLIDKLDACMHQQQVFRNPNLSIADLSEMLDIKPHVLSRLLNEQHGKNFRDYINSHRIDAFIQSAKNGQLEKLTFLGLAHEVGFNSKSTFNLAFKKYTGQSPRSYFKPQGENS